MIDVVYDKIHYFEMCALCDIKVTNKYKTFLMCYHQQELATYVFYLRPEDLCCNVGWIFNGRTLQKKLSANRDA